MVLDEPCHEDENEAYYWIEAEEIEPHSLSSPS